MTRSRDLTRHRPWVAAAFVIVIAAAVRPTVDPDFWWHLRTGELIWTSGIPDADPYSFTVPGRAWITHEWLSETILYGLYRSIGLGGLIVVFALLTTAAFGLAFAASDARARPTAAVTALAAAAAAVATGVRPQIFNLVGVALVMFLLERIRSGRCSTRWLWAVVPIGAVWSNLHSGYLLGVAVIAVFAVGEAIDARRGHVPVVAPAKLLGAAFAAFAAAALNPNGVAMWRYPFDTLRSPVMRDFIAEWHSPDFHEPRFAPFLLLLIVAVVTAVGAVASGRSLRATHALLLFGTSVSALQSLRHIAVFAVICTPIIAANLEATIDARRAAASSRGRPPAPAVINWALTGMLLVLGGVVVQAAVAANDAAIEANFPIAAVDWIEENELADAPGFNQYRFGGYLIWRDIPVFVDGRADVYGDEFLSRYVDTHRLEPHWDEPLDDFGVEWVMIDPAHDLAIVLAEREEWTERFTGEVASVWVRDDPAG